MTKMHRGNFFFNVNDLHCLCGPNKESGQNLNNTRRVLPYPACVFSLDARVVDERSMDAVAAAQIRSEVDSFLGRRGQSPENQIEVKEAELIVAERQSDSKVASAQRLVLKIQKALITARHTHTNKQKQASQLLQTNHTTIMPLIGQYIK